MGGAKQYDRTDLLDRAVELFRRQGYSDTSTAELVAELGVNRKSMYAEFGSKQGLFEAALERYDQEHLSNVLRPIEAPDSSVEAIKDAFTGYAAASEGWERGKGCLLCNTAVERAALDPGAAHHVDAYLARLTAAFRHALANGMATGAVDESVDLDEQASFLTMSLIGVAALIRAQADSSLVHAACRTIIRTVDSLRPAAR